MRYRLQRHDGTDCSATMVPITVLRMVPIQRYRHFRKAAEKRNISKSTCFKLCKKLLEKLQRLLKERGIDITFLKDDE